ncbi:MAG: electron transfer flavoprotein subunit alpha/FixB family protein [Deltaproteobacteria bacterium]|uniref:Electron transfer flavoprotein subunit alpha/FixB family protein n=1 Tax=Candidatus Desulfacyla euxinica TaxID=2841693 RepID=A0A8J6N2H8_9DELT|nr:electron transfer flavoprotein subunit alpha/FixB family protein [Candidatus Desulfacyla euxinica]MBL7217771.1 electron transfer flavoprotein subunit alpha/FixB family protein [Desulfobacteraceae bacterium]
MNQAIVIIAECRGGKPSPGTYELMTLAEKIRRAKPLPVKAIVLGDEVEKTSQEIAEATGASVLGIQSPHLKYYSGELYKDLLHQCLPEMNPAFVLVSQTTQGMDFAPGLAVRLGAGSITGVNGMSWDGNNICFSRDAYNGKIVLEMLPLMETTVFTVQPGAFKSMEPETTATPGPVEIRLSTTESRNTKSLGIIRGEQKDTGLAEADVLVAAGRGIGSKENVALIEQLAALFPRSSVAGSRPVCDSGWLEYKKQVGLTGATVSPGLYVACGISGAMAHRVGMQGSGFIVAISTDPNAAIFNIADVCICEDLTTFIPLFMEECKRKKRGPLPEQSK